MNPFTTIRQALGQLRADVEEMYQDILTQERAFQGEPAAPVVVESAPTPPSTFNAAAVTTKRRGRPRKLEAPPLRRRGRRARFRRSWTPYPRRRFRVGGRGVTGMLRFGISCGRIPPILKEAPSMRQHKAKKFCQMTRLKFREINNLRNQR